MWRDYLNILLQDVEELNKKPDFFGKKIFRR